MTDLSQAVLDAQMGELLSDLAGSAHELTAKQRETVVDEFIALIEGLYTHLPLKRAMYGVDPIQRLRLLKRNADAGLDDLAFHRQMAAIVTDLRDAHTRYVGPSSLEGRAAMLPFLVEMHGTPPDAHYIASKVSDNPELVNDPNFVAGVELLFWNGVPIDRAVDMYAEQETGGRPDSRRARALDSLTFRSLQYGAPPDEHWVVIRYVDPDDPKQVEREVRFDWRAVAPQETATAGSTAGATARRRYAIDQAREATRRTKKLLFAPHVWLADEQSARTRKRVVEKAASSEVPSTLPDVLAAKRVETPSGDFGLLRLWSFDINDDIEYVNEVIRLLGQLPEEGLIIDLRGNPGGLIWAAERALQLLGPQRITPTRFSLLATELTRDMAKADPTEFDPWLDSLAESVAMGELYSQAVPITPVDACNDIGQVYSGPVVAVVDANTYSAGDLFAAGFIDNELGTLVTVGHATGAGGANVWDQDSVVGALRGTDFKRKKLPAGITYSISVRRATRGCGPSEGSAIEDVGVTGHEAYAMTRQDLVGGNEDMLSYCGKLLAEKERTVLRPHALKVGVPSLSVTTQGLDRLDYFVDGRPDGWVAVAKDGVTKRKLPAGWERVEVQGFKGDRLRQRRIVLQP
jgi:C-terminal processing protease CtpA/Prc